MELNESSRTLDRKKLAEISKTRKQHLDFIFRERADVAVDCKKCDEDPRKFTFLRIDGADQEAFGVPHPRQTDKDAGSQGWKNPVRLLASFYGSHLPLIYLMNDDFPMTNV